MFIIYHYLPLFSIKKYQYSFIQSTSRLIDSILLGGNDTSGVEQIERAAMLDHDLTELYNAKTKRLNELVYRTIIRFPWSS